MSDPTEPMSDLSEYLMKNPTGRGYSCINTAEHETMHDVKAKICYIELEDNTNDSTIDLINVRQIILKYGTLDSTDGTLNIADTKYSAYTIVTENVELQNVKDLPKLIESLVKLSEMVSMVHIAPKRTESARLPIVASLTWRFV